MLTKDFKTFSKTKLLYDKGFNVIDATIVPDGKKVYHVPEKMKQENLRRRILRSPAVKKLSSGYSNASAPITGNYWS